MKQNLHIGNRIYSWRGWRRGYCRDVPLERWERAQTLKAKYYYKTRDVPMSPSEAERAKAAQGREPLA